MIKVNLIPAKRRKKPKPVPTFVVVGVMAFVFSVIVSATVVIIMNSKIEELENQKRENARLIEELNKKIAEVKDFEARNKVFLERKKIIEDLTRNQGLPVRILEEVSGRLTDGVWLVSMNVSRSMVNLTGVGFTNSDIVALVNSLKGSELFSNVILLGANQANISGVTVYNFNLTFNVNVSA